jgi:hypothetical protein
VRDETRQKPRASDPDLGISMPMPISGPQDGADIADDPLDLAVSLSACGDQDSVETLADSVVDILGSAVAIASGWVPPEEG